MSAFCYREQPHQTRVSCMPDGKNFNILQSKQLRKEAQCFVGTGMNLERQVLHDLRLAQKSVVYLFKFIQPEYAKPDIFVFENYSHGSAFLTLAQPLG